MEEILASIKEDLVYFEETIKELSTEIITTGVSYFPIYILHNTVLSIGKEVFDKELYNTNWNLNVSTLEELVIKKIIFEGRVDAFKKVYKNSEEQICFFIIDEKIKSNIVFIPFSK